MKHSLTKYVIFSIAVLLVYYIVEFIFSAITRRNQISLIVELHFFIGRGSFGKDMLNLRALKPRYSLSTIATYISLLCGKGKAS